MTTAKYASGRALAIALMCAVLVCLAPAQAQPEDARAAALAAVAERDIPGAVTLLERAVEAEDRPEERAKLQLLLAQFYEVNDQPQQAIATLRKVIAFDPETRASFREQKMHDLNVYAQMGNALQRTGDLDAAIYWWEQSVLRNSRATRRLAAVWGARRSLGARGELTAAPMVMAGGLMPSLLAADGQRLLVPALKLAEALQMQAAAGEDHVTITLSREGATVVLTADSDIAVVDGAETEMDVAPQVIEEELWVPLRFVVETFGHTIEWEAPARIAWVR